MTSSIPTKDEPGYQELIDWVRLSLVTGVGPRIMYNLLERFGTPKAALAAAPSELRDVAHVGKSLADRILRADESVNAEEEIELCREHGISILTQSCEEYPRPLREIPDPPCLLFVRGEILPQDAIAIGIVGTRHASQYGLEMANRLAGGLARAGVCVVSGLARGIDAAAHRAALAAGGRTLAVLGSGVLQIFPPEHVELADQVAAQGAVLSETPPRFEPLAGMFPQRNRIISGLSHGTIVVEAADRSGALITARHAMEQGREVFAVPGQATSRNAHGCNRLIRDGARLVETVDDVLEELGPLVAPAPRADGTVTHHPAELLLNEIEQKVLAGLDASPTPIDQLVETTGLPAAQLMATLTVLEMRHLVRRVSGSSVVRI